MLNFKIQNEQELIYIGNPKISAGTTDLEAHFDFPENFSGSLVAYFNVLGREAAPFDMAVNSGKCLIPWEVLSVSCEEYGKKEKLPAEVSHIMIVSIADPGRTTSTACRVPVYKSAFSDKVEKPSQPSDTLNQQALALVPTESKFKDKNLVFGNQYNNNLFSVGIDGFAETIQHASGSLIAVDNSAHTPFKGLKLFGKTTQKTTTGKNLIDCPDLTLTKPDTRTYTHMLPSPLPAGTYKFKCNYKGTSTNTIVKFMKTGAPDLAEASIIGGSATVTTSDDIDYLYFFINAAQADGVTAIITDIMVYVEGDDTYEPYTGGAPSPSPEYQQEPESKGASGSIGVTVAGKNWCSVGDITFIRNITRNLAIPLEPGTYMLSLECESNDTDYDSCRFGFVGGDEDGNPLYIFCARGSRVSHKVILHNRVSQVSFSASASNAAGDGDTATFRNVQIEAGAVATAYKPFIAQTLTAQTPNGLPGIPLGATIPDVIKASAVHMAGVWWDEEEQQYYISDTKDYGRGVYVQRILKTVLNGTESGWSIADSGHGKYFRSAQVPNIEKIIYPDRHKTMSSVGMQDYTVIDDGGYGFAYAYGYRIRFENMNPDNGNTIEDLKAYLAENPITTQFIMLETIETPIPAGEMSAYEALHTQNPNTTVYNDSDAHMEMDYYTPTTPVQMNQGARNAGKVMMIDEHGCVVLKDLGSMIAAYMAEQASGGSE